MYCDIWSEDILFIAEVFAIAYFVMLACFAVVLAKKSYAIQRLQLPR